MFEIILIGVAVILGLLFLGSARRDRLPPEAWPDGDTSPTLVPTETEGSNRAQRDSRTDRV